MPGYAKKNTPLFFARCDELTFGTLLRERIPGIQFVDGSLWNDVSPPLRASIPECHARVIVLWDRNACPVLPYNRLTDGKVRGPTSGVVIQYMRCVEKNRLLLSGDIGIGYERQNVAMAGFVSSVWDVAKSMNVCALKSVNPQTKALIEARVTDYFVGLGAREWADGGGLLKHCAADVYYEAAG